MTRKCEDVYVYKKYTKDTLNEALNGGNKNYDSTFSFS